MRHEITHTPGGMNSDVVETELGQMWYEEVKNLRQRKKGEWVNCPGYKSMLEVPGGNCKAAIEINDDLSGDRFLLIQRGTVLTRVDYDIVNSPVFGYENESAAGTITLPSGYSIPSANTLRFFVHSGVVRITGTSPRPLWYSYIDRTLFPDSYNSGEFAVQDWYLFPAELVQSPDINLTERRLYGTIGDQAIYFAKIFLIYDDAQYSVLHEPATVVRNTVAKTNIPYEIAAINTPFVPVTITIPGTNLKTTFADQRVTGIGLAVAAGTLSNDLLSGFLSVNPTWYVKQIVSIKDDLPEIGFVLNTFYYDGVNNDKLYIETTVPIIQELGWLQVGQAITLTSSDGEVSTTITDIAYGSGYWATLTFADSIADVTSGLGAENIEVSCRFVPVWQYDSSTGYSITVPVSVLSEVNEFSQITGFLSDTEDNNPDYTHHVVIEGVAYVNTQEDGEEDQIRYSPLNQLDNFPVNNIFPTDFGTLDTIKALVRRDNRLVILKGDLIGQGNFVGGRFYHDVESPGDGLSADFGYVLIGETLFYMDKDDIYQFAGVRPSPLLSPQRIKNRYLDGIGSSPFMIENKLNNELWIYLSVTSGALPNGEFLVFNPVMNEWYIRSVDYTPRGSFIDADRKMCVYSASDILTYDHGSVTFDETTTWQFTLMLHTERFARFLKKLHEIDIEGVNLYVAECISTDEVDESTRTDECDITNLVSGSPVVTVGFVQPKFFYKQLSLTIRNKTAAQNTQAILRKIILKVDNWR